MAAIDIKQIVAESIALAKQEVGESWTKLKPFAEHEFTQFAEDALFLATLKLKGAIDENELKARIELQKLALSNVLLAIKGIGIVTAQNVINGVLMIVGKAIHTAISVILPF
jgi:hypothetical protein